MPRAGTVWRGTYRYAHAAGRQKLITVLLLLVPPFLATEGIVFVVGSSSYL
jgi:hypothetical protein